MVRFPPFPRLPEVRYSGSRRALGDTGATFGKPTWRYLSGVENGKRNITVSVLERIAMALGIPETTLVER
jgi:hypothetical protein